ncbi:MAG: hypothetical protein CL402_00370 [Acidiferrobacteraceae bacterium]|nr:hypothetical protein [Acidiferrobacteraceae bacterium]
MGGITIFYAKLIFIKKGLKFLSSKKLLTSFQEIINLDTDSIFHDALQKCFRERIRASQGLSEPKLD